MRLQVANSWHLRRRRARHRARQTVEQERGRLERAGRLHRRYVALARRLPLDGSEEFSSERTNFMQPSRAKFKVRDCLFNIRINSIDEQ